jgi:ApeA N-terminal domain 1
MSDLAGKKQAGEFSIDGKEIFGELTVDGRDSLLRLRHKEEFNRNHLNGECILGRLHDLVKVSLIDCVSSGIGSAGGGSERYHFAEVFPHYVISGARHVSSNEEIISAIHFIIDDARILFHDFRAFGTVYQSDDIIQAVAKTLREKSRHELAIGSEPLVAYFAGQRQVFKVDTLIGTVSADHNPIGSFGTPDGVAIKNQIPVTISFAAPVRFEDAFDRVYALARYFEMLIGRQQNLKDIGVVLGDGKSPDQYLKVDWSMAPQRDARKMKRDPHQRDILLSPIFEREKFESVLVGYFQREPLWKTARSRFASKFNMGQHYDVDRLIATANIFDILPASIFPPAPVISQELKGARDRARKEFRSLPPNSDRDSVLNALGRIGELSLKKKIGARVNLILDRTGAAFPELATVADEAVNCRNYFVHGGHSQDFDYSSNYYVVWFFVDALEFVFGASDLIEAGWDVASWLKKGTMMSHPFGEFKSQYRENLQRMKTALVE